jgi:diadenosine tetraphosphate (Ap4A) HIT family hydrolase
MVKNFVSKHSFLKIMASLLVLIAPLTAMAVCPCEQASFFELLWRNIRSNISALFTKPSPEEACDLKRLEDQAHVPGNSISFSGDQVGESQAGELQAAKLRTYQHQDNCLFCQIYADKKPATVYDKNGQAIVIRSLSGGVLAIPHSHIPSLKELSESNKEHLVDTLLYAAHVARKNPEFSKKFYHAAEFHTGRRAYQTQFHIHMHMKFLDLMPAVCNVDKLFEKCSRVVLAENDVARVFELFTREGDVLSPSQLRVEFTKPVPHLDKLDSSDFAANRKYAARIVDGILLATQTIARLYPDCDYVTEITNAASTSLGGQTLDIRITLK